MSLKVSVSGIRGIWGDSLTQDVLYRYTAAFGRFILKSNGKRVLIGRDARPTGELITAFVSSVLNAMGIDVLDAGIVPTPTVLLGVREENLDGGMIITASHNPVQWNALKFVKRGGVFTGEKDVEWIKSVLNEPFVQVFYDKIGHTTSDTCFFNLHIQKVVKAVQADKICKKNFRVLLDPVNSAGSKITSELLKNLGCEVKVIHGEMNGTFERPTEPNPENLTHLKDEILSFGADVAFAQDPDADRLVIADEKGNVLSEELTVGLAVDAVLSRKKGDVVVNISTSMINDHLAEKYGVSLDRSKVGEANVVELIDRKGALIGGEGNGGVIYPAINKARDSLVGIALVIEYLALNNLTLSQWVSELPQPIMLKEKFAFQGDLPTLYIRLKKRYADAKVNELDGLRLDWGNIWVHVRPSNTEPVVRVIGEAEELQTLKKLFEEIEGFLA